MNTQHTPGPWQIADGRYIQADEHGGIIARCHGTNPADIQLIAAAPELLAALQAVSAILDQPWKDCDGPNTLAIAKADCALARDVALRAIGKATA